MFANWTALYPLLYICGHLATCVSVCLSVGLCTRNVNTQLLGTTNAVCTSHRKWNRELFPHPLGPQTSTFMPDFTWKCEWLFVFQCCATHTHTHTPHLRSTSFLFEVSPTHTRTSKFSSLTRTSPFGVTRGTCSNLGGRIIKGNSAVRRKYQIGRHHSPSVIMYVLPKT